MYPLYFLLCLLHSSACYQPNPAIDGAIDRLNGRIWVLERTCVGDKCTEVREPEYHYFFIETNHYYAEYYRNGITEEMFVLGRDTPPNVTRVINNPRRPVFNFIDSATTGDNFPVIAKGDYYQKGAHLTFLTNETFVVTSDFFGSKEYYRAVETPEEITDFMKRHPR